MSVHHLPRGGDTPPADVQSWLRSLFLAGHISKGDARDVPPKLDLAACLGFLSAHGYHAPGGMEAALVWLDAASDEDLERVFDV